MTKPGSETDRAPFFSIIVPVWNRQDSITRCLNSVFAQDFDDYEVVVVDDASDDDTLAVVNGFRDSRLRVLRHKENRGVCAARHTATNAALGKWILSLDSDWVLLPQALRELAEIAAMASAEIGVIGAYAKSDQGEIWPGNPLPRGPFGFLDYLTWTDTSAPTDFLSCRRRQVFESLSWPTDLRLETQFNLRVAKTWKTLVSHNVLAMAYTDSPNRYFTDFTRRGIERKLLRAADEAKAREEILQEFGTEMRRHVPRVYFNMLVATAQDHFRAGNRARGMNFAMMSLLQKPWKPQLYSRTVFGLMGPRAMSTMGRWRFVQWFYRLVANVG